MRSVRFEETESEQPYLRRQVPRKKEDLQLDKDDSRWQPPPGTWDDDLPYGGKVMVARKKKPLSDVAIILHICAVVALLALGYCSIYHLDSVIFRMHHAYALFGHAEAQHHVAQHYLQGIGVKKSHKKAVEWLTAATKNGHPQASYNLAMGHIKGDHKLPQGQAHKLMLQAAKAGLHEANLMVKGHCKKGGCQ